MSRIFREGSDPKAVAALRRAIRFLESQKFPWNAHYLAMTTPGESYEGKLAGRDGAHFMMRDTRKQRILIGYARDLPPGAQSGDNVKFTAAVAGLSGERSGGG